MKTELIKLLRAQAEEIAAAGHNGWGNTMLEAADALESLQHDAELWRYVASDHSLAWAESIEAEMEAEKQP